MPRHASREAEEAEEEGEKKKEEEEEEQPIGLGTSLHLLLWDTELWVWTKQKEELRLYRSKVEEQYTIIAKRMKSVRHIYKPKEQDYGKRVIKLQEYIKHKRDKGMVDADIIVMMSDSWRKELDNLRVIALLLNAQRHNLDTLDIMLRELTDERASVTALLESMQLGNLIADTHEALKDMRQYDPSSSVRKMSDDMRQFMKNLNSSKPIDRANLRVDAMKEVLKDLAGERYHTDAASAGFLDFIMARPIIVPSGEEEEEEAEELPSSLARVKVNA